jgi:CheY-like chemotaxis protein
VNRAFQVLKTTLQVVVAEDDDISRVMMQAILRKWGYDVRATKNGIEALELLCTSTLPTIGFLDWYMPDAEGGTICQSLRSISTEQPVHLVLITALKDGSEGVRALEAGADDFLPKPYSVNDLNAQMVKAERHLDLLARLAEAGGKVA